VTRDQNQHPGRPRPARRSVRSGAQNEDHPAYPETLQARDRGSRQRETA
jgi:hypothetical protein